MAGNDHPIDADIDEAAAYWANKLSSPECGPADREAFAAWRDADPAHAAAYERTERALRALDAHMSHPEIEAMGREIMAETEPAPFARNGWVRYLSGAAAAAGVIMVLGILGVFSNQPNEKITTVAEVYETAIGERSTVTLSDGSEVTLNTNSRIEVDFESTAREVLLLRGQALFEVAKDPSRPFVVEAGNQRITALGTAFDVFLASDYEVKVVLIEGRVAVDEFVPSTSDAPKEVLQERRVEMSPGEILVAAIDIERMTASADVERATSWRDGRLVFRSTPLGEAIGEVNRYSVEQLRLARDPRMEEITVSGVFNAGRSESFIRALETLHAIDAQRTSPEEITLTLAD